MKSRLSSSLLFKRESQRGFMDPDNLRVPIIFSLLIHVSFLLIFSVSDWISDTKVLVKPKELNYIKTVVVNKQGKISARTQDETVKVDDDKVKTIRQKEQKKQQLAEQKRIASKKAEKQKAKEEAEDKLKKDLEKKKKEQEKKAKKTLEEKNKKKQQKDKQEKAQQEKARKEALLEQRKKLEAQIQKKREAREKQEALVKKRQELEAQRQKALTEQDAPIIGEYEAHIQSKIAQSWSRPLSARNGMQATLQINLVPGGDVTHVKVIQSSGNKAFDLSATQAVRKASPLPVPEDLGVFTRNYRIFNLLFSPEDLWQ